MLKKIVVIFVVLVFVGILAIVCFLAYRYYQNRNVKDTGNLEEIIEKAGERYVNENGRKIL